MDIEGMNPTPIPAVASTPASPLRRAIQSPLIACNPDGRLSSTDIYPSCFKQRTNAYKLCALIVDEICEST